MDTTPAIELAEAELDEVFGGQSNTVCPASADTICPACNS
jgi:hypothetical protein